MNMNNPIDVGIFSPATSEEHALAIAANRGNARAFEALFERCQPKIFAVALRLTRVREDAEDIVQQTFQKAFVHLHQFEGKSSFSTWVTRIAMNEAFMVLRKRRGLREVPIKDSNDDEIATLGFEIPDPSPDAEVNYLKREATEILRSAIAKLPAILRTTVELSELGELSSRETAKRLGVSVAAVKGRVFQSRRKLRKTLRSLGIARKRVQRTALAAQHDRSRSKPRF
jgi:RNA polymerase sigma-70 factor, ECF subfamily